MTTAAPTAPDPPTDPPAALSRLEAQRGLQMSIWEGVWATVFNVLTGGAFVTGFALLLHASPFAMGLMAGLPSAVGLVQIPVSVWGQRAKSRRPIVAYCAIGGRGLFLPILLLPFLLPAPFQLFAFLFLLTLSSALVNATTPAWTSWMSDLVEPSSRGQYFGRRNMIAGLVSLVAPLPAGAFLDREVRHGTMDPRIAFAILFGISVVAALASFVLLLRQPEPAPEHSDVIENPLKTLTTPLADPNFRRFMLFSGLIAFGQSVAGQFFTVWQLDGKGLALPYLTVQCVGAVSAATGLLAMPVIGYLDDRFGSRPVLALSTLSVLIPPLIWIFTVPSVHAYWLNVVLIVLLNLISGVGWSGVGLGQFNLLLRTSPPLARGTYVALFSAFTGVIGGIAPILGGLFLGALSSFSLTLGPLQLNNYKLLFLTATLFRAASLPILLKMREAESRSARFVMEQIVSPRSVNSYRALRRLRAPRGEGERRRAVDDLATLRSPLAVDELSTALADVSLDVRDRAARALGAIGDAAAIPALIAALDDPAAGIGEAVADALGAIGDRTAAPALARATGGPDAGVRIAAMRALGHIPDAATPEADDGPIVASALLDALAPTHAGTCEAACGVLAAWGDQTPVGIAVAALPRLLPLLAPDTIERGIRLASARALGAIARVLAPRMVIEDAETTGIADNDRVDGEAIVTALEARLRTEPDPAVRAREAMALTRLSRAAGVAASRTMASLVPLLSYPGLSGGLAGKQVLEAIADTALPPGDFYPYLNLTAIGRDEAFQHILSAFLRREKRRTGADTTLPLHDDGWDIEVIGRYTSGDYARCLAALAAALPPDNASPAALLLRSLAAVSETERTPSAEETLLAVLLLRAATPKTRRNAAAV